jgi:hypothetical protein
VRHMPLLYCCSARKAYSLGFQVKTRLLSRLQGRIVVNRVKQQAILQTQLRLRMAATAVLLRCSLNTALDQALGCPLCRMLYKAAPVWQEPSDVHELLDVSAPDISADTVCGLFLRSYHCKQECICPRWLSPALELLS